MGLEEALIKGGIGATAKQYVNSLLSFSRWLFAKNRPSIVARLDSKSLSDGSDVFEFTGKGKPERLLSALDHLRSFRSTGEVIVRPRRGRAKDAPVVLGLEEALITAGTRRLDIAAAQLSASSALRPTESRGVVTGSDMRPLYFEDARDILGLQEAFIKAGMRASAYNYAGALRSFSRWLFAKNKPSLVARLDSKSLSGDVSGFIGKGNPDRLLRAIDELRTFRSTGTIALPSAQPNPHPPDVAPIHPESAVLMEPRLIGDAAAQHRASHEASSRREELRERQEDQPAPSVFVQEHVAFNPEQISPGELRRVLDHLDDQSMPSPASVVPEELLALEEQLHNEIQRQPDDQPVDLEEFTFNLEQFSPGELRRLLDTEATQLEVDHLARQSPIDDWSTTSRSQWAPQPAYLPAQSVSQSNLPSWDRNFEAYTSGPADQSSYDPGSAAESIFISSPGVAARRTVGARRP
ncbi:hypothetical protein HCN58_17745 [Bradyrhizobium sp. WSM 1791]|uniref:Uncharacterized protein n=1 Tax=Bradyrhizobium australiense TaxID=2721161 RepID=A0A7Y4GTP1_9BRAD|nr:hypothetical protein [Bradyrhizobium australiense]